MNKRNNSGNVHFPPDLLFMWYFALTVYTMLKLNCVCVYVCVCVKTKANKKETCTEEKINTCEINFYDVKIQEIMFLSLKT